MQTAATGPSLTPPRTYGACVRQARDAFRRYRQDTQGARQGSSSSGSSSLPQVQAQQQQQPSRLLQGCTRLKLQLPLPVAADAPPGTSLLEQSYSLFDEGDWPGGIVQRFRALRPLVDATLDGYDPQFLGMLEDPADGMGCWSVGRDTTLVGLVTNATFSSFAKLCQGGYGSRIQDPGHMLVAINPDWTEPKDIGQPWDRKLKAAAEEVLLGAPWEVLYSSQILRTSRGRGLGLLVGSYGLGWHLWPAREETSSSVRDECILWSASRPPQSDVVAALNEAAAAAGGSGKQGGGLAGLLDKLQGRGSSK